MADLPNMECWRCRYRNRMFWLTSKARKGWVGPGAGAGKAGVAKEVAQESGRSGPQFGAKQSRIVQ